MLQRKLGSTELETLGVTIAVKKFDTYLRGRKFILITDHKALLYIMDKKMDELKSSLARKVLFLSQYDFTIKHMLGSRISNADALSRTLYEKNTDSEEDGEPTLFNLNHEVKQTKSALDFFRYQYSKYHKIQH